MTRSTTASRAVAVLIIGAALSSGVLAAPTRSPIPYSIRARDLVQSQSTSDGLGTLSEGQTRTLATVLEREVPRRPSVSVSVGLEQRVDLAKRINFFSKKRRPKDDEESTQLLSGDSGQVEAAGGVQYPGAVEGLETQHLRRDNAKEVKRFFREKEAIIQSWFNGLSEQWWDLGKLDLEQSRISRAELLSRNGYTFNDVLGLMNKLTEKPGYVDNLVKQMKSLRGQFRHFLNDEVERTHADFLDMHAAWTNAPDHDARFEVFHSFQGFFRDVYRVARSARVFSVLKKEAFAPYQKILNEWHQDFAFDPYSERE
ncbi:hypothetical protein F5878DRAFT_712652 [Lentinula raphanica]|uniref:Uncharacterized protein n=1 Tax=Lentinula raphanica TaxID=153919 RepID=A0AA38P1D9_9AGAR|nr:hypothetical protein F5878DRAFT_712652 [Lentinula raphanica]